MAKAGQVVFSRMQRVVWGRPAAEVVAEEAGRLGAERVFLIVSRTLNRESDVVSGIGRGLGNRVAGLFEGIPAHVHRETVIAATREARAAKADLIVTVGGSSASGVGKMARLALAHGLETVDDMEPFRTVVAPDGTKTKPDFRGPDIGQVAVPTTLSGGEYYHYQGSTDTRIPEKQGYEHPDMIPTSVVLDPWAALHTPEWLWFSTGIRAVDHAVEGLCAPGANPYTDGMNLQALRLLARSLAASKAAPGDVDARLESQLGAWMSMAGVTAGVPVGASHGIGHVLGGACDVPHGYTSCIMLAPVLRWNRQAVAERQRVVSGAMGVPDRPAADLVAELVSLLGLPSRLGDVGVGRDRFAEIAEQAMREPFVHANPRPVRSVGDVLEILESAM